MPEKNKIPPKTRHQIAKEYGFSYQTLHRRLKREKIELPPGDLLPKSQKKIYLILGWPSSVTPSDYNDV